MNSKIWIILTFISLLLVGCSSQSPFQSAEIAASIPPTDGHGCTSFCLNNADHGLFGANLDNSSDEGFLYVNKRNVSKTRWEKNTAGEYALWTSKYGSFTFNIVRYQLAYAGMNEAGLMITTLALHENQAPAPDERFPLISPLWGQYKLDNFSTVEEVHASDSPVKITMVAPQKVEHFLVCNKAGDCATIEFLEGKWFITSAKVWSMLFRDNNSWPL
jgi:penicillin V acylase-like amidase (Ntn superfamily)